MKKCMMFTIILALFINNVYGDSLRITANPCPRSYSCMITDLTNIRMILFGGMNSGMPGGQYFNDVWSLDCNNETWTLVTPSGSIPTPRIEPAVAYYNNGSHNIMIVFGGSYYGSYLNDVWSLDLTEGSEAWTQLSPSGSPPSPRAGAKAIIDPLNNRFIIFGGKDDVTNYNETWLLDFNTTTWIKLEPSGILPRMRWAHSAAYDSSAHRMIIFAGCTYGQGMMNDVWALDLTYGSEAWDQLFPGGTQPDPRAQHFSVLDELNNDLVIGFGYVSSSSDNYNDVWVLNLNSLAWRQLSLNTIIEGRRASCAGYDPFNQQTIIFGGNQYNTFYFGDTYVLTTDTLAVKENQENRVAISPYIKISSNPAQLPCKMNIFVPFSGDICLKVFDVSGRLVNTLIKDQQNSGNYMINWDGKDNKGKKVAAGTYFINLEIDGISEVEKVVLIE